MKIFNIKHLNIFGMKYKRFLFELFIKIFIQNEVRKQDHSTAFISLATHNRKGCELAWKYMQENWNKIEDIYGEHDVHLIHFVEVQNKYL